MKKWILIALLAVTTASAAKAESPLWQTYRGDHGPGLGKRVVLISGDEEYRSEEALPQLGRILAERHGFESIVLFAQDPARPGLVDPNYSNNILGLETLREADLMVIATRFRRLPDEQMREIEAYLMTGRPVIGLRTATHAFNFPSDSPWAHWSFNYNGENEAWRGGFGKLVLGETWVDHHGHHGVESARGLLGDPHEVTTAIDDGAIWSPADVYTINLPLPPETEVALYGQVLEGMSPRDAPVGPGPYDYAPAVLRNQPQLEKNDPMMPIAWTKPYQLPGGDLGKAFTTTQGASTDLANAAFRRLLVQAAYLCLDLPIPPEGVDARLVGDYQPSIFGFHTEPGYWQQRNIRVHPLPDTSSRPPIGERIVLIGNGLSERMLHHGHFETELHLRFPDQKLTVRNLSRSGYTAGFRPHPSRQSQWAFPGAEAFHPEFAHHSGEGHYPSEDDWLRLLQPDTLLAFYGYNESFNGSSGLDSFRGELAAFVDHTLSQPYNGSQPPQLLLVSPIAFQDLSATRDLPDGETINANLALYTAAMREVAHDKGVSFIDLFTPTQRWFNSASEPLTVNGAHLNDEGYRRLAPLLAEALAGPYRSTRAPISVSREVLRRAVLEKDWYWFHDYQMPNGVHAYGRRYKPFGPDNYPEEIEKVRQLAHNRDRAIHALLQGQPFDLAAADASTRTLTEIATNAPERAKAHYRYGQDALDSFTLADGYQIELFASEKEFPNLANPAQLSFDNRGRLWVATLPSYPHYRPGDPRPNDKLLIYEDTDGDGKADKETVFADALHLPIGFELAPEGVYLSQAPNLVLLQDLDGDDRADHQEIILTGFDTHDTHHAISAFNADPSGAIYMGEGAFLHSNVETAYGPVRAINGGFYRFDPRRHTLERIAQGYISNPWGIAFDDWGQDFFLATSEPDMHWMLPFQVKPKYGQLIVGPASIIPEEHRVRPTSGLEFVSSRHFPDDVQGDFILNNNIGFLGAKQHSIADQGAGYSASFRQDLYRSSDPNFRPVALEFAPDGSLYLVDWHNQLIGHMQHSARDPLRDHAHGRLYRITHKTRPLVPHVDLTKASVEELIESLALPEARTRYRVRRELRGRAVEDVLPALGKWISSLDTKSPDFERLQLEALWTTWGHNQIDTQLLRKLLASDSHRVRAAAVRALRYHSHLVDDYADLLKSAAADPHPRARLEALIAASRLDGPSSREIVEVAGTRPLDEWTQLAFNQAFVNLGGQLLPDAKSKGEAAPEHLAEADRKRWLLGSEVYRREGHCVTCHQADGKGLPAAGFPPVVGTEWTIGHPERLIDLTLHGLIGPIVVNGQHYPGHVPMTQFNGLLDDEEVAAVLTYIRNAFGQQASPIEPTQVAKVRKSSQGRTGFWTVDELNKKYKLEP